MTNRNAIPFSSFALAMLFIHAADADDFFVQKVEPLLKSRCFECHSHASSIEGGLALDSKSGWQKGGESGPAIVPGKPEASLLIKAISHAEVDLKMPPKNRLSKEEIATLTEWVRRGAEDPRVLAPAASSSFSATDSWENEFKKRLDWWSLKPLSQASPPKISQAAWSREPIDRFVFAALEKAKLSPARRADPEVMLRRASFVLTGLPPTPREVADFARDCQSTDPAAFDRAYEQLVTRLLASPHFGERFARHWMDVVRYTDTYGYEWDTPAKGSHEYRDYLVRAFNDDVGFDCLLREQLAGDLLATSRIHPAAATHENLIGPMFYHLGEHRHGSSLMFNGIHQEMVNNKIDAFSKAFLATTVACARCHDHKLEAVSQKDYYALAAVFTTPRWTSRVADAPGKNDVAISKLRDLRRSIQTELQTLWQTTKPTPDQLKQSLGDLNNAKPPLHEIAYPLVRLAQREKEMKDLVAAWSELQTEWQTHREQRRQANQVFRPLGDLRRGQLPAGWVTEGDGMQHGFVPDATPLIALDGDSVVARLLPAGLHTHALSSKLPGALRMPPQHQVPGKSVSLNMAGGEFGGYLVMDDHAFQNETLAFFTNIEPQWKSFADATLKNGVQQVTIEFTTSSMNPNFPPRTGLARGLKNQDFGYDKRSWISITDIVSHDAAGTPQDELPQFAALYQSPAPTNSDDVWRTVCDWLAAAVHRWCEEKVQPGDQAIVDWLLAKKLLPNQAAPSSRLAELVAQYREIENKIPFPRTVNSMDERETARAAYPLNVRGNVDSLGSLVKPDFLQMFAGRNTVASSPASGRLELAESLLDPEHPLTARVYVNRVWQWIFGTGIVATPDDFGRLGDRPSHPELLDWLARNFMRDGWSTKQLVRRLVMSETFRQAGTVAEQANEFDPANRLLHHYPTRRLEAEAIRDSLLVVSGRFDPSLNGRPIFPPRSVEDAPKRLFSGPLDGNGRRSIYLQMSIMAPPKFLVGFNLPDLKIPTGRRDVTNVPSQALVMLNDPFVTAMAKHWGTRIFQEAHASSEDRLRTMFVAAFARQPNAVELQRWMSAIQDFSESDNPTKSDPMNNEAAWQQLAHAMFNTKEFIYFR